VALGSPELDDGAEDEPEFDDEPELDDEPEFDDEPELDEEPELDDEPEPEDDEPLPEDLAECPLWAAELLAVLCAAAGSSTITTPATATPAIPAPMVTRRRRRRAWSRAKTADTVRSSLCILGAPLGQATPIVSAPAF
jgi:hypothetical protein